MAVTIDGTSGITTPADTVSGNLTFTGTGNRITGDFSNATTTSRVSFQSSTTNGATVVQLIPNGTSTSSQFSAYGGSDILNTSVAQLTNNGTEVRIASGIFGSGTYLPMTFYTGGSERMRIDTSGRMLLGTLTAYDLSPTGSGQYGVIQSWSNTTTPTSGAIDQYWVRYSNDTAGAAIVFVKTRGTSVGTNTVVQSGDAVGNIVFRGADGTNYINVASIQAAVDGTPGTNDMPGRLIFNTTADGASAASERMRIDSSGNVGIGLTPSYRLSVLDSAAGARVVDIQNTASTGNPIMQYSTMTVTGTTSNYFFVGRANASDRIYIYGSGNIVNVNNSYGALSDVKLKENITDATPKLADLMRVKVRNYNLIGETQKQIGVVAQELEQVFPSMVDETIDRDAEGNELETTTKSVKYSVFVPMLIKAIQEQQALITQLQADIATLKGQA